MKPRARTLLAFAVAPLAVPLIMTPFGLIAGLQFHAAGLAAALVWAFGSAFAYGGAIVL